MRILLNEPRIFIDEILQEKKISLKDFSKIIKINYNILKKYRRGDLSIPEDFFEKIIIYSKRKEYWIQKREYLEENWGSKKGGTISSKRKDIKKRMKYVRGFINKKPIVIKVILNEFFCELCGALLGDGCISEYKDYQGKNRSCIVITGNMKLDSEYIKYINKKLNDEFGINRYYYEYERTNVTKLTIKNKSLITELKSLGFPVGYKYEKLKIPGPIKKLDWDKKKMLIRGLFDTDGSIFAKKVEDYRYPIISISSKSEKFLKELKKILRKQGYPSYISGNDVCTRGINNINRWFEDIGSSNDRNNLKYKYFLKNKRLPPKILGS